MMERRPEHHGVTLNGLVLHYLDWGGSGQPMVLLHGLASTARIWDLSAPLLGQHLRVYALDQRGHGESDQPQGERDNTFEAVVGDLHAFIQALELEHPIVVGHSWGGNVALQYAVDHPDVPSALVLVDGGFLELSLAPGMTWERTLELMTPPDFTGTTREQFLREAPQRQPSGVWSPQVAEMVLSCFRIGQDDSITPRLRIENHIGILRALWEQRPSQMYHRVTCPVLIIPAYQDDPHGERTAQLNAHKEMVIAMAEQRLPRSQTVWLKDTIHDVPVHRPRELAEAIAWFCQGGDEAVL